MAALTDNEKGIALFTYLRELSALNQRRITEVSEYPWHVSIDNITDDPDNVELYYRDRTEEEDLDPDPVILRVHKPEYDQCPSYPRSLEGWIKDRWDDFHNKDVLKQIRRFNKNTKQEIDISAVRLPEEYDTIRFEEDPTRVNTYTAWKVSRDEWVRKQLVTEATRKLFADLYQVYLDLIRDGETMELIVANGFLMDFNNNTINHPVLTRRVGVQFDASENVISVVDVDVVSELYTIMLQNISDIDLSSMSEMNKRVHDEDYHPLDHNDTSLFLKTLVHQFSSNSYYSDAGIPENWEKKCRFLMYWNPTFIFRKRLDGTQRFINEIIGNISETGYLPTPLLETVSGGKVDVNDKDHELTIEEQLAAVGGEDVDILLSKEANKEQLEIAQRIETYNAVLVQGPPGTGKTHTIANLMGHFLAQGKSVLVTSQTQKALSVLKEKVDPAIQSLCVAVMNDSNQDMERSIDGITSYMASHTSFDLYREIQVFREDRIKVIDRLAKVRREIFDLIRKEAGIIEYDGEQVSPSRAAAFVYENNEKLSYIPGKVELNTRMPLTMAEVIELYRSNDGITAEDEKELTCELPSPEDILSPDDFKAAVEEQNSAEKEIQTISDEKGWEIDYGEDFIHVKTDFSDFNLSPVENEKLDEILNYLNSMENPKEWMIYTALDGKRGGAYADRWKLLINSIDDTCALAEKVVGEQFGKNVNIPDGKNVSDYEQGIYALKAKFEDKGKIGKLDLLLNPKLSETYNGIKISGQPVASVSDCDLLLDMIELQKLREQCNSYWNDLLSKHGEIGFYDLDSVEPERIAAARIPLIRQNLEWVSVDFKNLRSRLQQIGISSKYIYDFGTNDSEYEQIEKVMRANKEVLPYLLKACKAVNLIGSNAGTLSYAETQLTKGKRTDSRLCTALVKAIRTEDTASYETIFEEYERLYNKQYLQDKREDLLDKVQAVAPGWADAIRNRVGVHGESMAPEDVFDAWKWKQYNAIIQSMTSDEYNVLQKESLALSKQYRKVTAEYAEKLAWYNLLKQTENDIDMRQALQGWKQTVKRIGKGTGKMAPKYKTEARKLMSKCQNAVPAWIMPMNRVIESLNPRENRFDVVIVDEASQSDVTALAVMYLGKKIIIVGDDRQVSPMAVGAEIERMESLENMYLKGNIPNSHLYTANTSLYDIAATTYQPLMLREHFRCVPEIIGFSNSLSYDYKIKPLRSSGSSDLLPAVVNYRVKDGERVRKSNVNEAKAIVSLLKSCIDQPEYKGKTFGVISLLGDDQVKLIQTLINQNIDIQEQETRRILVGNPSHFQGDERDVVFLSVVDSNEGDGPLRLQEFGAGDSVRKRYNVAASRAKDQLWVVDSLDAGMDLKAGDIRKRLIEYSINPAAFEEVKAEVEEKAESPFEEAVALSLVNRGYHVDQQLNVGAYRLDIVVSSGHKQIAIECDGERWHSGEAKIREDMERQTILERSGWKFIRIRGSEYYHNPEKTISRVIDELTAYGVKPENGTSDMHDVRTSDLFDRVKQHADEILDDLEVPSHVNVSTITAALRTDDTYLDYQRSIAEKKAKPVVRKIAVEYKAPAVHAEVQKNFEKPEQSDVRCVPKKEEDTEKSIEKVKVTNVIDVLGAEDISAAEKRIDKHLFNQEQNDTFKRLCAYAFRLDKNIKLRYQDSILGLARPEERFLVYLSRRGTQCCIKFNSDINGPEKFDHKRLVYYCDKLSSNLESFNKIPDAYKLHGNSDGKTEYWLGGIYKMMNRGEYAVFLAADSSMPIEEKAEVIKPMKYQKLSAGDVVQHFRFGTGIVKKVTTDKIDIRFDENNKDKNKPEEITSFQYPDCVENGYLKLL